MHLYCVGCKSHQECSNPQHSVSANGRAMVKATCPRGHTCCSFKGMASGAQGEGFLSDTILPFLKPLVNKAKDAAIAAAKKKAEELAKAAAEKLVNTLADKAKEKLQAKKGKGMGLAPRPAGLDPRIAYAGLAPAPSQMSASQLASIKKKMRNL